MSDRRKRVANRPTNKRRESAQPLPVVEINHAQHDAWLQQARALVSDQALPGIEDFRDYMAAQQRKLEVMTFLDHIEGPQVVVHISRPDGRISATLIAEVTPAGIEPYWDVTSTGRFKTHWVEKIPGGPAGLTQDDVLQKLTELYNTDFS